MSEEVRNDERVSDKTRVCEDSTDSDNDDKRLLRRIPTIKCVGRLPVIKEGVLMKQTRSFQRWQRRYFRLRGRTLYYAKEKDSPAWDEFDLNDATYAECSGNNNVIHSFQVITPGRCLVLCAESRGEMESWANALRSATNKGKDVADFVARLSCGDHQWYTATHARPTFCNVCREPLGALGTAHGLACEFCKFKAHKRCATRAPPSCKWTTLASLGPHLVEDADANIIMPHQWLEGNLPVAAKCDVCEKTCGSVLRLQDFRCLWCRKCVHAACKPNWRAACTLGLARASIVPPTRLHSVGPDDGWVPDRPPAASPLIVFVNSRSGDNQGVKFLRRFKQLLNPAQVFELSGAGPRLGLKLFRHFAPLRVLVCSGDGSVGWVLQEIDKLDMHSQVQTGVLPLGTGNDLARVLGWGASCDDTTNIMHLLERYERATTKMLDRWSIMSYERVTEAPPPPAAPPDIMDEQEILSGLQEIVQCNEWASSSALSLVMSRCAGLAGAGEARGGAAARAAHRLRRTLSLFLHARKHNAHAHHNCRSWEPSETTSDSETEIHAEKGSNEKTEKEQINWAVRDCALAGRADSVRRALRSLLRKLKQIYPQEAIGEAATSTTATAPELEVASLPVPKGFADSRRSSAASSASAQPLHPDNIPDIDDDIAKLISCHDNIEVDNKANDTLSVTPLQDRLSPSNLSSWDTSSCRHLKSSILGVSSLTIPNLVISDESETKDLTQGETYESDQITIIDVDKPYTDEMHFQELARLTPVSDDCTQDKKRLDLDVDTSSEGSMSEEYSSLSDIADPKPDEESTIGHIDSPEISDTYMNSETLHGESIVDDISSMLGQDVLMAMMGKIGENETFTDETTLFTSDTVSDIGFDSRNPSLEKNHKAKNTTKTKDNELEFGFENKLFTIENTSGLEEPIKYCSLAHFEEGSDIARKSFRRQLRKSLKLKRLMDEKTAHIQLPESTKILESPTKNTKINNEGFPQVSVIVEPPSPSRSEDKKSLKTDGSRMASVLNDIFESNIDTLSVHTPEPGCDIMRDRRQSDNPNLSADSEYGRFLSCSPAASRRISCGSLFKPGEVDKLSTSVSSIWGESGTTALSKSDVADKTKKLPIINPLVQLPTWPHVTQGFIGQCLLANADALCAAVSPLMDPDDTVIDGFYEKAVMNNYFGIGIDAKITLDFHNKREEHPEKCRSRARNYMWYGVLGSKEWVNKTYRHLGNRVQLECDGQRIPLPELQGIVVLNISSFMGGTNFWGGTRGDDLFLAPSFDDRVLEVVAVFGSAQMAASRLVRLQRHRLCQCRSVTLTISGAEGVPVQADGEAWLQPPGRLRIQHKNRAQLLCRNRALENSLRAWDEKQQMKAAISCHPTAIGSKDQITPAETAQLLDLLDAVNTLVKHIKLSSISESSSCSSSTLAVGIARQVTSQADALQDAEGKLLPADQLRQRLAVLVESCNEMLECNAATSSGATAASSALKAHLSRCEIHDGFAYLHADEVQKKGRGWLRSRRSLSEGPPNITAAQVKTWTVKDVQNWLDTLQLTEYSEAFAKHDVTGRELLGLARRDLRELGITKVGHVKRILQAVKELQ